MQVGGDFLYQKTIGELMSFTNDEIVKKLKPVIEEKLDLNVVKEKLKELRRQKGLLFNYLE